MKVFYELKKSKLLIPIKMIDFIMLCPKIESKTYSF